MLEKMYGFISNDWYENYLIIQTNENHSNMCIINIHGLNNRKTLLTDIWQQRKIEEIAADRRLSPAKNRGNRC